MSSTPNLLKIGFEPNLPPLSQEIDGKPQGLAIDKIRAICDQAGLVFQFLPVAMAHHQTALANGEIDIIAFTGRTATGDRKLDYSDAYMETGAAWFSPKENPWQEADIEARPRIATPSAGPLVGMVTRKFPAASVIKVENYPAALQSMLDDRADVAALNFHIGADIAERQHPGTFALPDVPFQVMDGVIAVTQGDPGNFLPALNQAIKQVPRA